MLLVSLEKKPAWFCALEMASARGLTVTDGLHCCYCLFLAEQELFGLRVLNSHHCVAAVLLRMFVSSSFSVLFFRGSSDLHG